MRPLNTFSCCWHTLLLIFLPLRKNMLVKDSCSAFHCWSIVWTARAIRKTYFILYRPHLRGVHASMIYFCKNVFADYLREFMFQNTSMQLFWRKNELWILRHEFGNINLGNIIFVMSNLGPFSVSDLLTNICKQFEDQKVKGIRFFVFRVTTFHLSTVRN